MAAQVLKYRHGKWYGILYRVLQYLLRGIFRIIYRVEAYDLDKIPRSGKIILCSNHISYFDPVIIGTYIPRFTYFMAKEELFKVSFLSNIITYFNAYPVRRNIFPRIFRNLHQRQNERVGFLSDLLPLLYKHE